MNDNVEALQLILQRNAFYKKQFYLVLSIFVLSLVTIGFLINILMHLYQTSSKPLYFLANEKGQLIHEKPTHEPLPLPQVQQWVIEAVEASNSFDYVNFRSQLQNAQKYFVEFAWREYMRVLTASNNLLTVQSGKEVWISRVIGTPKLIRAQQIGATYGWRFEVMVNETRLQPPYNTAGKTTRYKISVVLERASLLKSYQGLAILSMIKELISAPPRTNLLMPNGAR